MADDKVVVLYPTEDGEPAVALDAPIRLDPEEVLRKAAGKFREVVVLGVGHEGQAIIYGSEPYTRALVLVELCKAEFVDMMRSEMGWLVPGDPE